MITFATANANGTLTERLGIGLQNRVRRFESARYLQANKPAFGSVFCLGAPGRTRGKPKGFPAPPFFISLRERWPSRPSRSHTHFAPILSHLRKNLRNARVLILNSQFSARPEGTLLQSEATKRILNSLLFLNFAV